MNDIQRDTDERSSNPWKIGVFATAGAVVLLVAAGITFAAFKTGQSSTAQQEVVSQAAPQAASAPPTPSAAAQPQAVSQAAPQPTSAPPTPGTAAQPRENCDQYRVDGQRDSMRIAKDGAVGAMVGAGTGAAGGAIADGGSGAGKGAGIGAVVGAVAGAAYGLTQENTRVSDVESAYQDCLARNE